MMFSFPFPLSKGLQEDMMTRCMAAQAEYLFQKDKFYDTSFDTGDKTIQAGRRVDVFKLWLMWKAKGTKGFAAETDHKFAIARYLVHFFLKNTMDLRYRGRHIV